MPVGDPMPVGEYLVGLVYLVVTWGASAAVAAIVVRRRLDGLSGAPRVLAGALVALATLIGAHLLPGSFGLLYREAVALTALAAVLLAWRFVPATTDRRSRPSPEPATRDGPLSVGIAALALCAVVLFALASFLRLADDAPGHIDALSFGLPGIAEWIRSRSLLEVGAFFPLFEVRSYPNNGDVVFLSTILPFGNDAFLRIALLPLLAMTGVAVYAIGRELRAPAAPAVLSAALIAALPTVGGPALADIKPDVFMYATFAAGLLFLLRHARTGARSDLLLAGVGLGLAFGARWYGISSVVAVIAVWAVASVVARRPPRSVASDGGLLTALVLASGGYWLLRNWIEIGNPLHPVSIAPLGLTIFDAPPDAIPGKLDLSIADRLGQPGLFSDFIVPDYSDRLALPGLTLAAGTLLALAVALGQLRSARQRFPARALAVAASALVLAAVYAITPASAQGFAAAPLPDIIGANARWLVPALICAAAATAWAFPGGRWRAAVAAAALVAVLAGAHDAYGTPGRDSLAGGAALLAVGTVLYLGKGRLNRLRGRAAIAGAAALGIVVIGAGYVDQRRFHDRRFVRASPISDWILAHAAAGHRVGIAGGWTPGYVPIYAAFGPRYGNSVEYVADVGGVVRRYRRSGSFRRALREGGYDLLIVGRAAFPDLSLDRAPPLPTLDDPPEARWARAAGFREVVRDGRFILLASKAGRRSAA